MQLLVGPSPSRSLPLLRVRLAFPLSSRVRCDGNFQLEETSELGVHLKRLLAVRLNANVLGNQLVYFTL